MMSMFASVGIAFLVSISAATTASACVTTDSKAPVAVVSSAALISAHPLVMRASAAISCTNPYTVRKGDTLGRIASRCGVTTANLRQWNGLRSNVIRVGQTLVTRRSAVRRVPAAPGQVVPRPTPTIESEIDIWK